MKNKFWLFQIPIIALFTAAFYIMDEGEKGQLNNAFLRGSIFPALRSTTGTLTNIKFRTRGVQKPKNKVVVVAIDSPSLDTFGRWPWHRDKTAELIDKTFQYGAKVVGLDMIFSEPDIRVSKDIAELLTKNKLDKQINSFETDPRLAEVIAKYKDRLVTGWMTETNCQPAYAAVAEECPVTDPRAVELFPKGFEKFSYTNQLGMAGLDFQKTPIMSAPTLFSNIELFTSAATHGGYFSAFPDPDGYIRRMSLLMLANGKAYPSLALEMSRIAKDEDLKVEFDSTTGKVKNLGYAKSGRNIAVSPLGIMEVNFRGPSNHFEYISAYDILKDEDSIEVPMTDGRKPAGFEGGRAGVLKDAYVIIGLTALGVFDMRAFPFDSNTPGVEGHANILDNLLSGDELVTGATSGGQGNWIIILLMTAGAIVFSYFTTKFEAVPALLLFIAMFGGVAFFDQKILFANNINWNTSFFYIELMMIFFATVAAKYVSEERNKKFIRSAFSKYVSPALVDEILKDPTKLSLGGEKKDITICFSDIRSFTTFSEKMDAKDLARFLNDYLGLMTDIVFKHGGTLDKYIGDAIMAFWGAPLPQNDHAERACAAAAEMLQVLAQHRERYLKEYNVEVNVGIGINSGPVNVGNMGSTTNFSYTVIGDHVNLASRLEGLTKYYGAGIVTSRYTFDMITANAHQLPKHRTLDFVKVKGKKTAIELIQVLETDMSLEALDKFENARKLYLSRKWDEAKVAFKVASDATTGKPDVLDGPCEKYIERCDYFIQNPPGSDWDSSWEMTSK
ncbi:MAG: adenylate/guanylate cyclase domain-containing protein [Xanthomonadaceae bacterium]|nr:adenylate/guanylate cyclase domain-containing protein [Xanthomonadaceae bacterium]